MAEHDDVDHDDQPASDRPRPLIQGAFHEAIDIATATGELLVSFSGIAQNVREHYDEFVQDSRQALPVLDRLVADPDQPLNVFPAYAHLMNARCSLNTVQALNYTLEETWDLVEQVRDMYTARLWPRGIIAQHNLMFWLAASADQATGNAAVFATDRSMRLERWGGQAEDLIRQVATAHEREIATHIRLHGQPPPRPSHDRGHEVLEFAMEAVRATLPTRLKAEPDRAARDPPVSDVDRWLCAGDLATALDNLPGADAFTIDVQPEFDTCTELIQTLIDQPSQTSARIGELITRLRHQQETARSREAPNSILTRIYGAMHNMQHLSLEDGHFHVLTTSLTQRPPAPEPEAGPTDHYPPGSGPSVPPSPPAPDL